MESGIAPVLIARPFNAGVLLDCYLETGGTRPEKRNRY
jgi:hypothetical protein